MGVGLAWAWRPSVPHAPPAVAAPPLEPAIMGETTGGPGAVELAPDEQVTIEKVMVARDAMARIAESSAGDCDRAAKQIGAVVEHSRELLAASAVLERDPDRRTWIGQRYGARILASSSKRMALIDRCEEHEGLTRIFESLE